MKRAALYARVSTVDQHLETQLLDLRQMAKHRDHEINHTGALGMSGVQRDAGRGGATGCRRSVRATCTRRRRVCACRGIGRQGIHARGDGGVVIKSDTGGR